MTISSCVISNYHKTKNTLQSTNGTRRAQYADRLLSIIRQTKTGKSDNQNFQTRNAPCLREDVRKIFNGELKPGIAVQPSTLAGAKDSPATTLPVAKFKKPSINDTFAR